MALVSQPRPLVSQLVLRLQRLFPPFPCYLHQILTPFSPRLRTAQHPPRHLHGTRRKEEAATTSTRDRSLGILHLPHRVGHLLHLSTVPRLPVLPLLRCLPNRVHQLANRRIPNPLLRFHLASQWRRLQTAISRQPPQRNPNSSTRSYFEG
jgi:hypothetical protein